MTTRIEGHPYDGMLLEKGFRGFPSLAFMDAEGNVLATVGDRSVANFRKTQEQLTELMDMKARAAKGEKGLKFAIFAAEWELGSIDLEQIKSRADELGKLDEEQKIQVQQILRDVDVLKELNKISSIRDQAERDAAVEAAGKLFHDMLTDGYRPGPKAEAQFWSLMVTWADKNEKVKAFELAYQWMSKRYGDNPRMKERLETWAARLEELKGSAKP